MNGWIKGHVGGLKGMWMDGRACGCMEGHEDGLNVEIIWMHP